MRIEKTSAKLAPNNTCENKMEDMLCKNCKKTTKYVCITCDTPICNRCECSIPEYNEDSVGWIAQRSVAYCKECGDITEAPGQRATKRRRHASTDSSQSNTNLSMKDSLASLSDNDSSSAESDFDLGSRKRKAKRKTKGRKGNWKESHIDDMIDVIVNSESYKRKLIFTNVKKQKNSEVYEDILMDISKRCSERKPPTTFPFNVQQMRTKFKWCVSTCKKLSMTIRTATGIKRIQDEKGFGKWFDLLYPLIQSRDSCQPDQAVEPPVSAVAESENNTSGDSLFVPIRRTTGNKREKEIELLSKSMETFKKVIENDSTKDILNLMREDMKQSREQDMQFQQMMLAILQQSSSAHQTNQFPQSHSWPFDAQPIHTNTTQPQFGTLQNTMMGYSPTSNNMPYQTTEPQNISFIEDDFHRYSPKRFEKL